MQLSNALNLILILAYDNSVIYLALDATFHITWQLIDVPARAEWPADLPCPWSLAPDVIS